MSLTSALSAPDHFLSTVLVIVGPTAVGKTAVAVAVAQTIDGEVVGLDSRQIYRGMAIGTAQPSEEERQGIPHHLYGILDPNEPISAGEYVTLVEKKIDEIVRRGHIPIICGGSGLYYRALTRGLFEGSATRLEIRQMLKEKLQRIGPDALLSRLQQVDPEYARMVHPNNHKRLIRALEIYEATGLPPSEHFRRQKGKKPRHMFFTVFLNPSKGRLHKRISVRTEQMINSGWINEVLNLLNKGYSSMAHPMDSVGYEQIVRYLSGKLDHDEMVDLINLKTRQYARKQIKWFRQEKVDLILDVSAVETVTSLAKNIVKRFKKSLMERFQPVH